jgi:hypothetical protein
LAQLYGANPALNTIQPIEDGFPLLTAGFCEIKKQ